MIQGLPRWLRGNEPACSAGDVGSSPGSGRFPWRRKWQLTPIFLPGESHGQRSLAGYSPWTCRVRLNWVTKSPPPRDDLGVTSGETGRRHQSAFVATGWEKWIVLGTMGPQRCCFTGAPLWWEGPQDMLRCRDGAPGWKMLITQLRDESKLGCSKPRQRWEGFFKILSLGSLLEAPEALRYELAMVQSLPRILALTRQVTRKWTLQKVVD